MICATGRLRRLERLPRGGALRRGLVSRLQVMVCFLTIWLLSGLLVVVVVVTVVVVGGDLLTVVCFQDLFGSTVCGATTHVG